MLQLLPAIDLLDGRCVRLRQGNYDDSTVFSDDPVEMALRWRDEGAERLHLVDLDGAKAGRPVNQDVVRRIVVLIGFALAANYFYKLLTEEKPKPAPVQASEPVASTFEIRTGNC